MKKWNDNISISVVELGNWIMWLWVHPSEQINRLIISNIIQTCRRRFCRLQFRRRLFPEQNFLLFYDFIDAKTALYCQTPYKQRPKTKTDIKYE